MRAPITLSLMLACGICHAAATPNEITTPYDFGAVGNGTADDSTALQNALSSGRIVTLPGGSFRITRRMNIPANGGLVGAGTILHDFDTSPAPGLPSANDYAFFTNGANVRLEGFKLKKTFIDGSYACGIVADHANNITIKDVEISGYSARYGIHIIESENIQVTGCYIHSFMMNTTADMISDSPAGLRVTRCVRGIVSNNRVINIQVGTTGLVSVSPIVPTYGPQGYQSDNMTIMQSDHIVVSGNLLTTSGEGVDMLLSKNCTVSNNVISDIWFQGVKMLGVSFTTVSENFISDCYQGIGLATHRAQNAEASGNTINGNVIRDIGSPGSFGVPGPGRVNFSAPYGIELHDATCRFNVVTDNVIADTQTVKTTQAGVRNNGTDNLVSDNIFTTAMTIE